MPKKFDRCVLKVSKTVRPYKGRTKKQSAYAICRAQLDKEQRARRNRR